MHYATVELKIFEFISQMSLLDCNQLSFTAAHYYSTRGLLLVAAKSGPPVSPVLQLFFNCNEHSPKLYGASILHQKCLWDGQIASE